MSGSDDVRMGTLIRARRLQLGMTQAELAIRAGMSRSYLCDIEKHRVLGPTLHVVRSLAHGLGLSLTALLNEPPTPRPDVAPPAFRAEDL